jgi:PPK2 family polyphosphate:nucleotide phosphotransferase
MKSLKVGKNFNIKKTKTSILVGDFKDEEKLLRQELSDLQYKLYAENRRSVLVILQGMDAAGKDSLVANIMNGINPQGITVTSFKTPSAKELSHDFIWRHYIAAPEKGMIGIFNRSQYENVLISKVHPELIKNERLPLEMEKKMHTEGFWKARYQQINDFEKNLATQGTLVIKLFLHLSKDEQAIRFLGRIENRQKHWKFSASDIEERTYWNDYMNAYQGCIRATSTKVAPWYVLPADDKKTCRFLALRLIVEELRRMNLKFPKVSPEQEKLLKSAGKKLKMKKKRVSAKKS